MKKLLAATAMLLGLATTASAHDVTYTYTFQTGHVIHVACWRGPWKEVIWDHPEAMFLDDLRAIGYDFPTSRAIAERICRDQSLVNNPEGLKSTMIRIYYDSAAYREPQAPKYILR